jgi:hypothetical protein
MWQRLSNDMSHSKSMNIQVMKQWGWGEIGNVMPYAQTLLLLSREMLALQN